jgi:UDP-N-acetylglucosamine--N-acetylmuramyl-(pentapeptide) pyrophosphoryl-undecaprenol N-acetylglucosamine transferase
LVEGQRSPVAEPLPDASDAEVGVSLSYVGEAGGIEEALALRASIPFRSVDTGQIRGRSPGTIVHNLIRMRRGAAQCAEVIREFRPNVIFVTGGYVAAPVAWAARWARPRVPLLIYLPDLTPGLSIRLTSRLATRVAVSFPEVALLFGHKAVVTGYPVRPELFTTDRAAARDALLLSHDLPVVLVFGGSRGARSINRGLVMALPALLPHCQVLHISGELDWPWIAEQFGLEVSGLESPESAIQGSKANIEYRERYHPYPYLHEKMMQALAAADLVIARAGASVLGEFPAVGLPSILVPYPYAGQHQDANASYLASRSAAVVVRDDELPTKLAPTVLRLLEAPAELAAMADAAAALARPDAARNIVRELYQLADTRMSRM